jgi:hypothetical protein
MRAHTPTTNEVTSEGAVIEFDGTSTITLDDTYRIQVAASFGGPSMKTPALEQLRQRYLEAVQRSARCTYVVEAHVEKGAAPSEVELGAQREAREELVAARRAYFQELTTFRSLGFLAIANC